MRRCQHRLRNLQQPPEQIEESISNSLEQVQMEYWIGKSSRSGQVLYVKNCATLNADPQDDNWVRVALPPICIRTKKGVIMKPKPA